MGSILVTGGTGTLGTHVVRRLADQGNEPRLLSRRAAPAWPERAMWFTGDLNTGKGLDRALDGVTTVVHCAHSPASPSAEVTAMANLISAAARAGVEHVVQVSIVGMDHIPLPYYRGKVAAEELLGESGLDHTVLRATQFHELLLWMFDRLTRLPVVPLPTGFWAQPIAADEVAERLVAIALEGPAPAPSDRDLGRDRAREQQIGGPQVRTVESLADAYFIAREIDPVLVRLPLPGRIASGFRSGANLTPKHREGVRTWEEFLEDRFREKEANKPREWSLT
ncbi:SDR family oxidoreductase [Nocardiopsis sediminis]|uniref:SDR family oxidoreductase n=1 Tax=Nocardiopsis sediminis TaxID=1778267 RepID=A0ABV8FV03_9ACTN